LYNTTTIATLTFSFCDRLVGCTSVDHHFAIKIIARLYPHNCSNANSFNQSINQSSLLFRISFHISKMNHYKMNYKMGIDPKLQKAMTACFNPIPNCGTGMTMDYTGGGSNERRAQRRSRSKQREAMRRMEDDVKKHVAQAAAGRSESLLTREDDATLLTEVDLINPKSTETETDSSGSEEFSSGTYSSSSETRDLNTIADSHNENRYAEAAAAAKGRPPKTMSKSALGNNVNVINNDGINTNNDNNGNVISPTSSAGGLKHTTTMYTQSMRSKFEYVRKHQQFAKPGSDPPCDKSVASTKSLNGADAVKFMNWNLTTRRNELAKQILKRRQNMPTPTASRTGFDP
jgi:hypothetical protein